MNFLRKLFSGEKKKKVVKVDIPRRFDLVARVGQGSMSKVWRARDSMSGRTVALKVLDKEKTKRLEARFPGLKKPTEGEVAITLQHPNIVRTLEHGITIEDEQFLVMEFVEGVGLSFLVEMQNQVMKTHRLRIMIEIGRALEYFHNQKWIHRDICPRNILVDSEHHAKLIDFGLVVPNTPDFQKPGNRTGTANYMAPELIKRQQTDQRIDIFSFGVTCYEMWTKRHPWDSTGQSFDAAIQHINTPPKDIRLFAKGMDDQVADCIMRAMERDPRDRWQTMGEMVRELRDARARLENVTDDDE